MKEAHLWPEPVKEEGRWLTVSARLEGFGAGNRVLWYRIPVEHRDSLTNGCEPLLLGILFLALNNRRPVRVHGRVSPSLLRNLEEFQTAWASWAPSLYGCVEIRADEEIESPPTVKDRPAITAFSGGVDSAFTAYRHTRRISTRFPRNVRAAVMVRGFDIPLDELETFEGALARSSRMTRSLELTLIPMSTNFRELTPEWIHSYGSALASCMMLLSEGFSEGLVGLGMTYANYMHLIEGSNALTNSFLSCDHFTVVPDSGGFERADKISFMRDWPEFLENMRVCWRGPQKDRNCCVCEKCIRTILTLRVLGIPLPPSFPQDVSDSQIKSLGPLKESTMKTQYDYIVRLAMERSINEPWVEELRACLSRNRRRNRWLQSRLARTCSSLKRAPYYSVRPSALVFRLKHGHPPEEKS